MKEKNTISRASKKKKTLKKDTQKLAEKLKENLQRRKKTVKL
jgi:hypothetical protein